MMGPSVTADFSPELSRTLGTIRDAGGTLVVTSRQEFQKLKEILLKKGGGNYGTLPTADGRTKHQVTLLWEGTERLTVEYYTST